MIVIVLGPLSDEPWPLDAVPYYSKEEQAMAVWTPSRTMMVAALSCLIAAGSSLLVGWYLNASLFLLAALVHLYTSRMYRRAQELGSSQPVTVRPTSGQGQGEAEKWSSS